MKTGSSSLAALVGVVLIGMTGFGVFLPIFPFLALELDATPTAATIAMGAYSLGQLVASPFWGRLSDRVGRKPVLIAGLLGGVVSYLWIARAGSVEELGAARLFGGLMAGNIGAAFAAAADLSVDKTRARNMGLLGAAVGFAFIAGPALGAFVIGGEPSREAFAQVCVVSAGLAGMAALTTLLLFRETLVKEVGAKGDADRPPRLTMLTARPALLRFVTVMFLAIAAQALMETTFGLWADVELSWGPREVGWTLAALGAGAVLIQGGLAGRASRVLGEETVLLIGLGLFAAGFGGLAVTHEVLTMSASLWAIVVGIGLATPALNSLIAEQASERERGAVMGLSQSASALGRVAGPLGAGALFDTFGAGAPFLAAALVMLAALFVALEGQGARAAEKCLSR
jgi:DHA1 family tetracycline resistance protein-like MFS transporter